MGIHDDYRVDVLKLLKKGVIKKKAVTKSQFHYNNDRRRVKGKDLKCTKHEKGTLAKREKPTSV